METQEDERNMDHSRRDRLKSSTHPGYAPGLLIDRVANGWRGDVKTATTPSPGNDPEAGSCDLEDEGSCPNVSRGLIRQRRSRRMLALVLLLLALACYAWQAYLRPRMQQEWDFKEGFLPGRVNGTYGIARAGDFDGTLIKEIHADLVPGGAADQKGKRRLVFVGDIHGCKEELLHLLSKVDFDPTTDHLIATGDVVSKGPDSPGVLDELIKLGAESVRGNHEDRLVQAAKTALGKNSRLLSAADTSRGYSKDQALLVELKSGHMRYLHDMSLMLRIPALPLAKKHGKHHIREEMIVVHAGLVPHVPLDRQDPYFVMNMRSIDHKTHVPSALHETERGNSEPWFDVWGWYQERLDRGRSTNAFHVYSYAEWLEKQAPDGWFGKLRGLFVTKPTRKLKPQVAVYGHDSKMDLQLHRWSKGLDSACVSGGQLTAMVLDAKGKTEIVQVECKDYR